MDHIFQKDSICFSGKDKFPTKILKKCLLFDHQRSQKDYFHSSMLIIEAKILIMGRQMLPGESN
jgi:hypothetical protein